MSETFLAIGVWAVSSVASSVACLASGCHSSSPLRRPVIHDSPRHSDDRRLIIILVSPDPVPPPTMYYPDVPFTPRTMPSSQRTRQLAQVATHWPSSRQKVIKRACHVWLQMVYTASSRHHRLPLLNKIEASLRRTRTCPCCAGALVLLELHDRRTQVRWARLSADPLASTRCAQTCTLASSKRSPLAHCLF